MLFKLNIVLFLGFLASSTSALKDIKTDGENELLPESHNRARRQGAKGTDAQMREKVMQVIQHFKQDDPRGLPGEMNSQIPDPMPVPDQSQEFTGAQMTFTNMNVHGLRRLRLEHVRSDLSALKVSVGVSIDELRILGDYSMATWLGRSRGNFTVTIVNVSTEAEAAFVVSPEGYLIIQQIETDLKFQSFTMKFENLGWLLTLFQTLMNSIIGFLFDSIKPMILQEVETNIRGTFNREARSLPQQFPNSINPLDMAIAAARNHIKEKGLDPMPLPDHKSESWSSSFLLSEGELQGLATIHRTGSIILGFDNNTISVNLHLGAENLKGKYKWSWGLMRNMMRREGALEFNLEYVTVAVKVQQPANLDLLPSIDKIDLDIGNIAVLSDGAGTLDYVVEAAFNVIPNIFRKQIIDALEYPVCKAIEDEMKKLKIEAMIEENM